MQPSPEVLESNIISAPILGATTLFSFIFYLAKVSSCFYSCVPFFTRRVFAKIEAADLSRLLAI